MRYNKSKNMTADIKCPFFSSITEKSISCEGMDSSCRNVMWFVTEQERYQYVQKHCFNYPNECPIALEVEKKYE
jgi:collagenase-like PrtC family protease